jgi:hypothetical protein
MRSILVVGLLIATFTSASSAHSRPRHRDYSSGAYNSYASYGGDHPNFSYDTESSHNSSQWGGQPD